jgi:LytS/YehU family sensor histidine kinase
MRFSDRLRIAFDASPESLPAMLPALLLQPLAENAIEHGRNDTGPALHVRVAATVVDGRLCIVVNNSSPQLSAALAPRDYRHGLMNVELRLRAAYGSDARLTIGPDHTGGTSAFLDLPWRCRAADAAAEHSA